MKTMLLTNGVMISLMMIVGMGAVSCKFRGAGDVQEDHSGLSGIYDDKWLLRLAEVQLPIEERTATRPGSKGMLVLLDVPRTYRFEICDASGESCVGAFENHESEDVLIEITKVDSLQLGRARFSELAGQIEEQYDTKIAELQKEWEEGIAVLSIGDSVSALKVAFAYMVLPAASIIASGGGEGSDSLLNWSSSVVEDRRREMADGTPRLKAAIKAKAAAMDALDVLPIYLNIKNGLLSTDPDNHVSVVGDPKADVGKIAFALARHINNATLNQDPKHPAGVVQFVCFVNRYAIGGKLCDHLSS